MSSYFRPDETRKARKLHRCTYCGEEINTGDIYKYQTGIFDGRWFVSKMHPECFEDLCDVGDGEYTPYSNERPATLAQVTAPPDSAPPPTATPPDRAGQ